MEPIDVKVAKAMVANYETTRKTLIDDTYGINDTRSIFLPIDQLKNYVSQLPADATGVRIYLAAYDDADTVYPNQTTAVIVGTVSGGGGNTDAITGDESLAAKPGLLAWNKSVICPPDCG